MVYVRDYQPHPALHWLYIYVYVCIYTYISHIHMYTYIHIYICMYVYIYVHINMYMQIYICTFPPKNREIALWPNVRVLKCEYKFHKGQTYLVQ